MSISVKSNPTPSAEPARASVSLPVVASLASKVRRSHMVRWRTVSFVIIHILIIAHVVHWKVTGRTISPIEPAEAMFTLNKGWLNAGFIFFSAALLSTLVFGRFMCGWGCHLLAYQDLCAWMLKKVGIKPKPLRARLLVLGPLALALYMYVWPSAYRWAMGHAAPELTNHLTTTTFWQTFPGLGVAILTFAVCGFGIVYFFGSKGFCTYACPYGGFFRVLDRVSPARIRVTDDCTHCGHCTASCTSNVRVHEEVALYGMVVDSGCMKCMDCTSVCPENALYFGYGKPALGAKPVAPPKAKAYDFSLWEEVAMIVIGVVAMLTFRGLYGRVPLLLSMALAAMTAFIVLKFVHVVRSTNVRWQNLQLKRGGRITRAGWVFALSSVVYFAFTAHSSAVQFFNWRGHNIVASLGVGDTVWTADHSWWSDASEPTRARAETALADLEWSNRWGLWRTPAALGDLVWLYLAQGRDGEAERAARRLIELRPTDAGTHRGLAGVLRKVGRLDEAEVSYRAALAGDPSFDLARRELAGLLISQAKWEEAIVLFREVVASDPDRFDARYNLGMALLEARRIDEAVAEFGAAVDLQPTSTLARYNLAVALFMSGQPADALPYIEEAVRLDPSDRDANGFLEVVRDALGGGR